MKGFEGSERFRLDKEDLSKIGRGFVIALLGAALTYAADTIPGVDFGDWTPVVVAVASAAINAGRKWLSAWGALIG